MAEKLKNVALFLQLTPAFTLIRKRSTNWRIIMLGISVFVNANTLFPLGLGRKNVLTFQAINSLPLAILGEKHCLWIISTEPGVVKTKT